MAKKVKNKNTSLTVRAKIVPPPSKKEICDALLARAEAQYNDKRRKAELELKDAKDCLVSAAMRTVEADMLGQIEGLECDIDAIRDERCTIHVSGTVRLNPTLENLSKVYMDKLRRYNLIPSWFRLDEEKKKIRDLIMGERVREMLKDSDTVEALDRILLRAGAVDV